MSDNNDSSSDDEDYVPIEDNESESNDEGSLSEGHQKYQDKPPKGKRRKRKRKETTLSSRKRKGGIKLDEDGSEDSVVSEDGIVEGTEGKSSAEIVLEELSEDLKKKKADDLWSSFLKDVNVPLKPKQPLSSLASVNKSSIESPRTSLNPSYSSSEKVTVTKIYNFAGEEVKVTEELKLDSMTTENKQLDKSRELSSSARLILSPEETPVSSSSSSAKLLVSSPESSVKPVKGLSSVLNKITNKKNNINTLMKSKLDWESFKVTEGITDDLQIHNKGKDGYLEKMAFLERSDLRQFELEKNLRAISRSKK